mmetsp:Transcript_8040/g.23840  ORF Transcript_8040/g.23840 Transcript_8040/m.23840 type:complete len:292 (-) Transcript_8040:192-1067(-)
MHLARGFLSAHRFERRRVRDGDGLLLADRVADESGDDHNDADGIDFRRLVEDAKHARIRPLAVLRGDLRVGAPRRFAAPLADRVLRRRRRPELGLEHAAPVVHRDGDVARVAVRRDEAHVRALRRRARVNTRVEAVAVLAAVAVALRARAAAGATAGARGLLRGTLLARERGDLLKDLRRPRRPGLRRAAQQVAALASAALALARRPLARRPGRRLRALRVRVRVARARRGLRARRVRRRRVGTAPARALRAARAALCRSDQEEQQRCEPGHSGETLRSDSVGRPPRNSGW